MKRFNSRVGAALLLGLAAIYAVGAFATGHSAQSELPPDLTTLAADAGVDVWQAVALLADDKGTMLIDVRGDEQRSQYALPGAFVMAGATAEKVAAKSGHGPLLLVASSDEIAQQLAAKVKSLKPDADVRFLRGGAGSWYLAFDMPVALFSTSPEPHGYREAHATARSFVNGAADLRSEARGAAIKLARLNYTPDLLGQGTKPKAVAGGRKKIAGGCGG